MTAPAHQRHLTVGPVATTLFLFALPSLGVNILQSLNNSVNSIWIGQFLGEEALAASANAGLIMFLMFSALFGFSMATTILIGQNMGRRDVESVRRVMGTATGVFFVSGAVTAALGWIFAPHMLRLMARVGSLDDHRPFEERAEDRPEHRALIRRAGAEGMVLLRMPPWTMVGETLVRSME